MQSISVFGETILWADMLSSRWVWSLLLVLGVFGLRRLSAWYIMRGQEIPTDSQRRFNSHSRNLLGLIGFFGMILIWAPELEEFALSLTALAVAIVIATKEFILCLLGAIFRGSARPFVVGDWIQVGDINGEVVEQNLFTTIMHEIDPRRYRPTGRLVSIPNSALLTQSVINQNFHKRYIYHRFQIHVEPEVDVLALREYLLDRLEDYGEDYKDVAERYITFIRRRASMDIPRSIPRIRLYSHENGRGIVDFTLFCPTRQAVDLEQKIMRDYYQWLAKQKIDKTAQDKPSDSV